MFSLSPGELADISGFIKEKYGVNLSAKSTLIEGRLGCYLQSRGFNSYGEYFDYAKNDPSGEEMANLINRLTTNHTFFLREDDHFKYFTKVVMPWIATLPDGKDLRVWCAGCSTGEEPYGLSIYILEEIAKQNSGYGYDTTILASDISEKALSIASKGIYTQESLSAIPDEWLQKYFTGIGDGLYQVAPKLRENVAFKKINLLDDFSAKKPYQTIICRNVMIYFDTETRISLINRFYDTLIPGGYLFVGHSESITSYDHGFTYIQPSIYRKPLK